LVSAEVGCHPTFASVARDAVDPQVVFVRLEMRTEPDRTPALRSVLECVFSRDADTDGAPRA
jgi:hypothetical protein